MKLGIKKIFMLVLAVFLIGCGVFLRTIANSSDVQDVSASVVAKDEKNNFDFIKSEETIMDFIYDGSVLLYGGALLIVISLFGMFFSLKPGKNKKNRHDIRQ